VSPPAGSASWSPIEVAAASCHSIAQKKEDAPKAGYQAAYGHVRNGVVYPDPFPCEPPSVEESLALKLAPQQRIALEHILLGSQLSNAAKAAGVTRMTLYRWFHYDPNFQAAYNTWHADAIINSRTRTLAMTNSATSTLECAVQSDPRMALAVLKATGVLNHTLPGPTDPVECKRQIDLNQQQSQPQPTGAIICASDVAFTGGFSKTVQELAIENRVNGTKQVELHAIQQESKEQPLQPPPSLPAQTSPLQPTRASTDESPATNSQQHFGSDAPDDKTVNRRTLEYERSEASSVGRNIL